LLLLLCLIILLFFSRFCSQGILYFIPERILFQFWLGGPRRYWSRSGIPAVKRVKNHCSSECWKKFLNLWSSKNDKQTISIKATDNNLSYCNKNSNNATVYICKTDSVRRSYTPNIALSPDIVSPVSSSPSPQYLSSSPHTFSKSLYSVWIQLQFSIYNLTSNNNKSNGKWR